MKGCAILLLQVLPEVAGDSALGAGFDSVQSIPLNGNSLSVQVQR